MEIIFTINFCVNKDYTYFEILLLGPSSCALTCGGV